MPRRCAAATGCARRCSILDSNYASRRLSGRRMPIGRCVVVGMLKVDDTAQVFWRTSLTGRAGRQAGEHRGVEIRQAAFDSVDLRELYRSRCVEAADGDADRFWALDVGEVQRRAAA